MNAVTVDVDMLDQLPARTMLKLVEKQQEVKKFFTLLLRSLNEQGALWRYVEEHDYQVSIDPDFLLARVSFAGDGPALAKMWAELRRNGYKCDSRPKKGDTSFNGWFEQEGWPKISLNFSSTLCKRAQVGTETVEQPIYETQCGELTGIEQIGAEPSALPAPAEIPF